MTTSSSAPASSWDPTSALAAAMTDDFLTRGVLSRRCVAWVIDLCFLGVIVAVMWCVLVFFGLVTFGLGLPLLGLLPLGPFFYHFGFLAGRGATPGQSMCGLSVRRDLDLGPPSGGQALVSVIGYYVTLATSGLLLLAALVTTRHRALHDLVSGLVVVRSRALTAAPRSWNMAA